MIQRSLREASKSTFRRAQVGAVIVSGGRVLASGHNQLRGYRGPRNRRWEFSLHAEVDAILNAIRLGCYDDLKNATMFVSHIRPSGTIGNACPCEHCMETIRGSGRFKRIVFTVENGEIAEIKV